MRRKPKIVVTNRIHAEVADRLATLGNVDMNRAVEPWTPAELKARSKDVAAILGFMTDRVDAALLAAAPELRIVACALKGFDSYDVDACTAAGVWVSIVPDLLTNPTAELAVGLAIALARQVRVADAYVRDGAFKGWRPLFYGRGLDGAIVAVVGLGKVGSAIVDRLQGFGCARILGIDPLARHPRAEPAQLEEALAISDYAFVATPLTPESRGLLGGSLLGTVKPGLLLVNVGRGSVVDENAVIAALTDGRLGGYAADVFAFEDWSLADRPRDIPEGLRAHPRTLLTPHIGSAVARVRLAIENRAADNIIAALTGNSPPDAINVPLARTYRAATDAAS